MTEFTPEKHELRNGEQLVMIGENPGYEGGQDALIGIVRGEDDEDRIETWCDDGMYFSSKRESGFDIVPKARVTCYVFAYGGQKPALPRLLEATYDLPKAQNQRRSGRGGDPGPIFKIEEKGGDLILTKVEEEDD